MQSGEHACALYLADQCNVLSAVWGSGVPHGESPSSQQSPGEHGFWITAFAWEIFNFTCVRVIAFGLASSVSRLLEYHLARVPVSPSIPTCCCCKHTLVGDAIYQLHPCWLRHPASGVAAITKQGEHANMMQLLLSKNSRRNSMNHLSSPAPRLQGSSG